MASKKVKSDITMYSNGSKPKSRKVMVYKPREPPEKFQFENDSCNSSITPITGKFTTDTIWVTSLSQYKEEEDVHDKDRKLSEYYA